MTRYSDISPMTAPIPAKKQEAKRHYGVHPYFTRRPYNVVKQYILHYSHEGDRILDPFGGSGVTAIEAFLENRVGIHNDINPLANFIAKGIIDLRHGNIASYITALDNLHAQCSKQLDKIEASNEKEVSRMLKTLNLPVNAKLPINSDVDNYYDLFLPSQLASLSILKNAIDAIENRYVRRGMLLAWSSTLTKLNKTFLSSEGRLESRGGSSIFSIYRYKVAKTPVSLPPWQTFFERANNVIEAKVEIDKAIELKRQTGKWSGSFEIHKKDIEELGNELKNQADYIFTDPPYGGHISYLDLSMLWNVWLSDMPSKHIREKELIVGGELKLGEGVYIDRLGKSIQACVKMLKPKRWMSVVFQHWNPAYFNAILQAATDNGMELRAAVSQVGDPIWSMHKKKGKESVLAGEMILTFYKSGRLKGAVRQKPFDLTNSVANILNSSGLTYVYGEHLFNQLIMNAWESGAINSLNITRSDFTTLMIDHGWCYDTENHFWVRKNIARGKLF